MTNTPTMDPKEALDKLLQGNERFVQGQSSHVQNIGEERREELTAGQSPFAAVLACADSRTPPEHIFDAGLGELFVCRNAGNLIDQATLGSFEYAVAHTGCPLVAVMGHNKCGAVGAAVAKAKNPAYYETHNVDDIVMRLMPAVIATSLQAGMGDGEWVDAAAKRNVMDTCRKIVNQSQLIAGKLQEGTVAVVGLWYDLGSGKTSLLMPYEKMKERLLQNLAA